MMASDTEIDQTMLAIWSVIRERDRQNAKWGRRDHDPLFWLAILTEELGEVAKEVVEMNGGDPLAGLARLRNELVQLAAVAVAAVEYVDRTLPSEVGHVTG
jgi:NTP pyrophosphatase (non-canonical NTP hydrolase)